MNLFISVGTAPGGYDALVRAADRGAARLELRGLAQIGDGQYLPQSLSYVRFLSRGELRAQLARRPLVVCHGGMGILGEALRAGCRVICVPRSRPTSRRHPSNDQRALVEALAARLPLIVCRDPDELENLLERLPVAAPTPPPLPQSNVPEIIAAFLRGDEAGHHR